MGFPYDPKSRSPPVAVWLSLLGRLPELPATLPRQFDPPLPATGWPAVRASFVSTPWAALQSPPGLAVPARPESQLPKDPCLRLSVAPAAGALRRFLARESLLALLLAPSVW